MATAVVLSLAFLAGPEDGAGVLLAWSLLCAVIVLRRTRQLSGEIRSVFRLIGLGGLLIPLGVAVRELHGAAVGVDQPIPSPADLLHMPAYACALFATYRVFRSRTVGRDPGAWIDTISIAIVALAAIWLTYLGELIDQTALTQSAKVMHVSYTVLIAATTALFLRIASTPGARPTSYYLVGGAATCFLIADVLLSAAQVHPVPVELAFLLTPISFSLLLAAVVHPTSNELVLPTRLLERRVGLFRVLTTAVTIMAPAIMLFAQDDLDTLDRAVLTTAIVSLSVLVVLRTLGLLNEQQRLNRGEKLLAAEVAAFAQSSDQSEIARRLLHGLRRITAQQWYLSNAVSDAGFPLNDPLRTLLGARAIAPVTTQSDPISDRHAETLIREAARRCEAIERARLDAEKALHAHAAEQVAANERRFRALVQNASDIFIVLDADGRTTYVSDAISRVLGYELDTLIGKHLNTIVHENDQEPAARQFMAVRDGLQVQERHEFRAYTAGGDVRLFEAIMTDMTDVPEVNGVVINATDVTAERSLERDLKDAETIDPLTLQLNRKAFIDEIDTALRRASISGAAVSIAIIDLDDFKTINDALGPVLADQALVETASRIRRAVRIGDVVARLSGDEFGILMPDGYSALESVAAVERVLADLQTPFKLDRRPLSLNATAGISINVGGTDTASVLLKEADTALGTGKREAPGKAVMFEEEMSSAVAERLDLRSGFERALHNDEMRLVYQPILDMSTGRIVSLEALARWKHPERGEISPRVFIPIAEDSNTITPLGEWALRTACQQVNEWTNRGLFDFTVSVNMSGQTLIEDDVISRVRSILDETAVDPARIIIEITETVLIDDTEFIADRISALRALGVALAIDDFGTGYSSLSYLQRYEFDYLKIDRAFVRPLESPKNVKDREIVAAIIRLAKGLGATTVAEGIEGEGERVVLHALECDRAQGFLFHRPKEVAEIFDILCEDLQLDVAA